MKIVRILLFVFLILTSLIPISNVEAYDDTYFDNILNIEKVNDKIIVNINISSIKDISYFSILLDYDKELLELDTNNIKTSSRYINTSSIENPNTSGKIVFANIKDEEIIDKNVATLSFNIIKKNEKTDIKIKCDYEISDNDLIINTRSELKGINL